MMLQVFELAEGQDRLVQFVTPLFKTMPETSNQVSLRFNLKQGKRYVVIPANKLGQECDFYLSFYFAGSLNMTDIRRIDRAETCK